MQDEGDLLAVLIDIELGDGLLAKLHVRGGQQQQNRKDKHVGGIPRRYQPAGRRSVQ